MAPFSVTEWDWFCLRVQLHALDCRSPHYAVYFDLAKPDNIYCRIYSEQTAQLLDMNASTSEQLQYYRSWVNAEKKQFEEIIKQLPAMSEQFDAEKHVVFQIMHPDPNVDKIICNFRKRHIVWNKELTSGFKAS